MTVRFEDPDGLGAKLYQVDWLLPALAAMLGFVGVVAIFSATSGVWMDGAFQHGTRIALAFMAMLIVAMIDIRVWYSLAYPAYLAGLVLLVAVDVAGINVNGSQRWLGVGPVRVQPSELMKPAVVLAMARYYHDLPSWRVSNALGLLGGLVLIGLPMMLVLRQPDLGTSLLIGATGVAVIFLAGVSWRVITLASIMAAVSAPLVWQFGLKAYQRERILTFLDPSRDPAGASYHITQSKIAFGSGGMSGKGFGRGTQQDGGFVPENLTDFISTIIGEEFGFIGMLAVMGLYMAVIGACIRLSVQARTVFARLLIMGLTVTFTLYVFINLGMVTGLLPVVGVPLPLVSYGGTVVLVVMGGFGLMLSAHLHSGATLPKSE